MSLSTVAFCYTCILANVVCALSPTVKAQIQGCSFSDVDLGVCLNQGNASLSIDSTCCKMLNKAVQAGYNCLCLLVASSLPFSTTPILLPLSNCYIYVPPLTLCRVLAPMPVVFPPSSPEELMQPSTPPNKAPVSLPPHPTQVLLNPTRENTSAVVATQPPLSENPAFEFCLSKKNKTSNGNDKIKTMACESLFLFLVLQGCILLL